MKVHTGMLCTGKKCNFMSILPRDVPGVAPALVDVARGSYELNNNSYEVTNCHFPQHAVVDR